VGVLVRRSVQIIAWASLCVIVYATLTHIEFVYSIYFSVAPVLMHPEMKSYVLVEHVIAFAVFGAIFSSAYPRRVLLVCCFVSSVAILLEYFQTFTPDRHGTFLDAFEKMSGGALGIFSVEAYRYFRRSHALKASETEDKRLSRTKG
jgi:hypothetical protein